MYAKIHQREHIVFYLRQLPLLPVREAAKHLRPIAARVLMVHIILQEIVTVTHQQTVVTLIAAMLLQPNARKVLPNVLIPAHILNA